MLRYTAKNAYRCFLPDLAGFTPRRYAGPLPGSYHFKHNEQNNQSGKSRKQAGGGDQIRDSVHLMPAGHKLWRREWDLNPRWSFELHTRFPVVLLRPLGHLSLAPNVTKNSKKSLKSKSFQYAAILHHAPGVCQKPASQPSLTLIRFF